MQDAEAPWPCGCGLSAEQSNAYSCIVALRGLCALAEELKCPSSRMWLQRVTDVAEQHITALAPPPLQPTSEPLAVMSVSDPWPSLAAAAWKAATACAATHDGDGAQKSGLELGLVSRALSLSGCLPTALAVVRAAGLPVDGAAADAVVRCAFRPAAPWRAVPLQPEKHDEDGRAEVFVPALMEAPACHGPPIMAFASSFFWGLCVGPPRHALISLLLALSSSEAVEVLSVPFWLPFVALVSVLCSPLGDCVAPRWAWEDIQIRDLLEEFMTRHFRLPPTWLWEAPEWLQEVLRGLCDRLVRVFVEDSFGDGLLARVLLAFILPAMPPECRRQCWGKEDPAILALLARALPCSGVRRQSLLWQGAEAVFATEAVEDAELMRTAIAQLHPGSESWPVRFALCRLRAPTSGDSRLCALD